MLKLHKSTDVVVIGGGLAGVTAAVSAARLGSTVSLITNRPVLGGNSSSEVRVWVVGASAHGRQRFSRETGIMGELFLENQYRNPDGNPYYWDQTVLDLVRAEANITLHLNTDVRFVEMADSSVAADSIASVTGWTMGSEIETQFSAPVFIDCTGDGLIGHLAGASYRVGRESSAEFGESWAPEIADDELLGSSLFFYTKDAGHAVPYVAPLNAKDISSTPIPMNRIIRTGDNGCDYWWIEWGGLLDTVTNNEEIRDELWSVVFGIWDYIKNSGKFDADNLTLEWVGSLPGKREYRRFWGDYTLTQNDILAQRKFDDAVAFGGWSIDLHPVEGVYAEKPGAQQRYSNGSYDIPYRCLYSADVNNLLFAGRNISATHVAFGSTRVMATCATQGQAVGTAAHLVTTLGVSPRNLGDDHIALLQQTLQREDAPIIGVSIDDADDRARSATVTASSSLETIDTTAHTNPNDRMRLDRDVALIVPVNPRLDSIRFVADVGQETTVRLELWDTDKPQNYVPVNQRLVRDVTVSAGAAIDIAAMFDWAPGTPCNAVIVIRMNEHVALHLTDERPYGVMALVSQTTDGAHFDARIPDEDDQLVADWSARELRRKSFAAVVSPRTDAYSPDRVTDGLQRPFGGPQLWSSALLPAARDLQNAPEVLTLNWDEPQTISSVRLVFNDDVDEDLINLHRHVTPFPVIPELVAAYDLEVLQVQDDGTAVWRTLATVERNRHRLRIHDFDAVQTTALRVVVTATNGSPYVTIAAVRAFATASARATSSRSSFTGSHN
ncbi:FAD-dependent oxidoreductase [Salinibacterium sp. PAMC 21357]|uniref:FAD-dependent oxidoreductase n=1 Tax=Salinibacterium sp. PAMC 21357 TaxID=1112215 RepID=UPI0002887B10|nr:FAD-dependent oxidoreductase [Salinibacterium sp. PAMC 21357]